jgi:hypothetical protein
VKNPFRSEAEAYRFVIGTVVYFAAIVVATAVGGRWWGVGVFVVLTVFVLIWFFRRETREQPPGWNGRSGRVNADLLREVAFPPELGPNVYVCGPTSFVEAVADSLVGLGHKPGLIKTERFGGT